MLEARAALLALRSFLAFLKVSKLYSVLVLLERERERLSVEPCPSLFLCLSHQAAFSAPADDDAATCRFGGGPLCSTDSRRDANATMPVGVPSAVASKSTIAAAAAAAGADSDADAAAAGADELPAMTASFMTAAAGADELPALSAGPCQFLEDDCHVLVPHEFECPLPLLFLPLPFRLQPFPPLAPLPPLATASSSPAIINVRKHIAWILSSLFIPHTMSATLGGWCGFGKYGLQSLRMSPQQHMCRAIHAVQLTFLQAQHAYITVMKKIATAVCIYGSGTNIGTSKSQHHGRKKKL